MIIQTKQSHVSSFSNNSVSSSSLDDIINDFKSLEELNVDVENKSNKKENGLHAEYDKYLQIQGL